ncbi:MAG: hypothetical protein IPM77_15270 [Crocinitomicaceae bacterium]|nr:hypothetical protein [Crocinitomicaceae bacterium]
MSSLVICDGDSLLIFGEYKYFSGVYYDTLQTVFGCDSIIVQALDVLMPPATVILSSSQICEGDSLLIFGEYRYLGGVYYDTVLTIMGCDSVLSKELNVILPLPITNQGIVQICSGDSILIYDQNQSVKWDLYDTLQTINGCDSILSMQLEYFLCPQ